MNKNLEILEFHKILEMLANLSANEITREKVRTIVPCSDLAEARTELEKTNDAFQLSVQFGAPPFHAFQDMRMGLRRAKSGARLSLKDLLEIATVLRQIQSLSDWYDRCSGVESSWTTCSASWRLCRICWKSWIAPSSRKRRSPMPQARRWQTSAARSDAPGKSSGTPWTA